MKKFQFELAWRHLLLDLVQVLLGLGLWWNKGAFGLVPWWIFGIAGALIAIVERNPQGWPRWSKVTKFVEVPLWALALALAPSAEGWDMFFYVSIFNLLELFLAGSLLKQKKEEASEEEGAEEEEGEAEESVQEEAASRPFLSRFLRKEEPNA